MKMRKYEGMFGIRTWAPVSEQIFSDQFDRTEVVVNIEIPRFLHGGDEERANTIFGLCDIEEEKLLKTL